MALLDYRYYKLLCCTFKHLYEHSDPIPFQVIRDMIGFQFAKVLSLSVALHREQRGISARYAAGSPGLSTFASQFREAIIQVY